MFRCQMVKLAEEKTQAAHRSHGLEPEKLAMTLIASAHHRAAGSAGTQNRTTTKKKQFATIRWC